MKKNPFRYSDDNKRYHTLYYYNKRKFGVRVYKAVIDAGFSCPNIDGRKGTGGCAFCDGGSGYFTSGSLPVEEQLVLEKERIYRKDPNAKICAYFQSNSNTYAPPEYLKSLYERVIPLADTLSIATRPDCIYREIMDLLQEISEKIPLTIELGLQTVHEKTAADFNRCYSYSEFLTAYNYLKNSGIRVCVHIINGLPGESADMMYETARRLGELRPDAVKIHMLHIIEKTPFAERGLQLLSKEEYIDIVVRQLELLPPETVIERVTGDGDRKKLIAPLWTLDKISVIGGIDKAQFDSDSFQGKHFRE